MPQYYSAANTHATSASAATQVLAARTTTGTTSSAEITRLIAGAKGAAQDNQTLWQAWKPTVVATAGTTVAAEKHDTASQAAITVFATVPTVGTKGAQPLIQLPFNSRAMVQWVALNPDEALALAAGGAAAGDMSYYDEEAAAVAVNIVYQITWSE